MNTREPEPVPHVRGLPASGTDSGLQRWALEFPGIPEEIVARCIHVRGELWMYRHRKALHVQAEFLRMLGRERDRAG